MNRWPFVNSFWQWKRYIYCGFWWKKFRFWLNTISSLRIFKLKCVIHKKNLRATKKTKPTTALAAKVWFYTSVDRDYMVCCVCCCATANDKLTFDVYEECMKNRKTVKLIVNSFQYVASKHIWIAYKSE